MNTYNIKINTIICILTLHHTYLLNLISLISLKNLVTTLLFFIVLQATANDQRNGSQIALEEIRQQLIPVNPPPVMQINIQVPAPAQPDTCNNAAVCRTCVLGSVLCGIGIGAFHLSTIITQPAYSLALHWGGACTAASGCAVCFNAGDGKTESRR